MTTRARLLATLATLLPLALPLAASAEPAPPVQAPAAKAIAAQAPAAQSPVIQKPATETPAVQAAKPDAVPAASANAPALDATSPAAPETTVGGGAANRSAPVTPPVTMPAGSATGSLLQTLFALIVVLGVLGALAWFLKRYGPKAMGGNANMRVVGSLNLGGRERLLVVEIGNQWIVVGASPGRVNGLATMPKQESADMASSGATLLQGERNAAPPASSFADWLKQTIDKRNK